MRRHRHTTVAVIVPALGCIARRFAPRVGQHHIVNTAAGAPWREVAVASVVFAAVCLETGHVARPVVDPRDRAILRRVTEPAAVATVKIARSASAVGIAIPVSNHERRAPRGAEIIHPAVA